MISPTDDERVTLIHEGAIYDPFERGRRTDWRDFMFEQPEEARRAVAEGSLITPFGDELAPAVAKRVKARLLRAYADMPAPGTSRDDEIGRWLIPEVWRWGHMPMLSGQPRAGKSTLVVDLIASLLMPERRFLGHYEPAELTDAERNRGVWLINAENPAPELRSLIESTGLEYCEDDDGGGRFHPEGDAPGWLMVDHLEALGGASAFDIRDPAIYDIWANRIMDLTCAVCDGRDESPPLAVIADGLTAILGSDTTAYGQWYAKFRDLMHELDVPNALVVVHSPMNGGEAMNGVESIAQADGTWKYQMSDVHNARAPRTFSGSRRLLSGGIDGGRVILRDGRPLLIPAGRPEPKPEGGSAASDEPEGDIWEAEVRDRLTAAGRAGLMTVAVTGDGKEGTLRRAALRTLAQHGSVRGVTEGKGKRWFLV